MIAILQEMIEQETSLAIPAAHLTPRADLYALGLTSFDAIRLLVAVERAFKIELPRDMLKRETAASIASIAASIASVRGEAEEMRLAA